MNKYRHFAFENPQQLAAAGEDLQAIVLWFVDVTRRPLSEAHTHSFVSCAGCARVLAKGANGAHSPSRRFSNRGALSLKRPLAKTSWIEGIFTMLRNSNDALIMPRLGSAR